MRKASSLLVSRVAQDLRKQAFASSPGAFLGSEAALVERFNVSRPTFRQAAKLVEQEQLLVIKPGAGGGYFARQPDSAAVAHVTGLYLQSRNTTAEHLVTTFIELYVITARSAAVRRNAGVSLQRLSEFAQHERDTAEEPMEWKDFAHSQEAFMDILTDLGGNPLIKLFFEIAVEMTNYLFDSIAPLKPAKIQEARMTRIKLMEAIQNGDVELVDRLAHGLTAVTSKWMLNAH